MQGKIIAVEPIPPTYAALQANAKSGKPAICSSQIRQVWNAPLEISCLDLYWEQNGHEGTLCIKLVRDLVRFREGTLAWIYCDHELVSVFVPWSIPDGHPHYARSLSRASTVMLGSLPSSPFYLFVIIQSLLLQVDRFAKPDCDSTMSIIEVRVYSCSWESNNCTECGCWSTGNPFIIYILPTCNR